MNFTLLLFPAILFGDCFTLDQAVSQALSYSYELQQFNLDREAAYGEVVQAGVLPNPIFSIDYGDVGVVNAHNEDKGIEYQLEQLIELGGKRSARICLAEAQQDQAELMYALQRIKVKSDVQKAYFTVALLQANRDAHKNKLAYGSELSEILDERLRAGTLSAQAYFDKIQEVQSYPFELEDLNLELAVAIGQLEVAIGNICLKQCSFDSFPLAIPCPVVCNPYCTSFPECQIQDIIVEVAERVYALESANGVPDISVRCGVEQDDGGKHASLTFGASLPLPFFDRNQGNKIKAYALLQKAEFARDQFYAAYARSVENAYRKLQVKCNQVSTFQNKVLVPTQTSLNQFKLKQEEGRGDRKEVLDAEIAFIEAEKKYRSIVLEALFAKIDYEKLTSSCYE